jgi:glycosyltransferase involved in cell wall biosynthesis
MRVLLAIDAIDSLGGSERHARELLHELVARGHDARLLLERPPGAGHGLPADLAPVHVAPDAAAAEGVARALRPDVVHVLSAREPARTRALARAAPVTRFVQDHTTFCPGLNKIVDAPLGLPRACVEPAGLACVRRYWLQGGCACFAPSQSGPLEALHRVGAVLRGLDTLESARGVVVASDYMRRQLVASGLSAGRVHVIPYFTLAASRALRPEPPPPEVEAFAAARAGHLMLASARLVSPDKGIEHLLTTLGKLPARIALVVAGAGPAEAWLRAKCAQEGLAERVCFAGRLSSGQLEALYPRCEVVAFPSTWDEPFGHVGIEAMAHQRPVAAFDVGGVREWLVEGATGLLAPRGDTDRLAAAIARLFEDRSLRLRLGRAGAARVEALFRPRAHLERLERVLAGAG